jgi:hypothetical protein
MGADVGNAIVEIFIQQRRMHRVKKYLCKIFKSEIASSWGVLTSVELQ